MTNSIDVTLLNWVVAFLPLAAILVLLLGANWKASAAAPVGFFIAVISAFTLFRSPIQLVAGQAAKGVWDAIFILYVIFPALLLYEVSKEAGAFQSLRRGIEAFTPNDLVHVLAFGWGFASFLQGITGFGAPVAVTAPLLVAVGVRPVWAVAIPLVGHCWANTFGTLAVAWIGLNSVTDVQNQALTALTAAVMLFVANLLAGTTIAWLFGRARALKEAWLIIVTISAIHGLGQAALAPFAPSLAVFLPTVVALGAFYLLGKTRRYSQPTGVTESRILEEGELEEAREQVKQKVKAALGQEIEGMPLLLAISPYLVLMGLIVVVLLVPPVHSALSGIKIGLSFPAYQTGLGVVTEARETYGAFAPLTHPGSFLLVSALFAFFIFRRNKEIGPGRMDEVLVGTVKSTIPSAIALFALVPLALVMQGSGQTQVLALGIAAIAPGPVYAFLAPFIGLLGTFMTSSNLSSNVLFGALQSSTADALGISQVSVLAGQTAGGALGNAIAPGTVLLGTGAVGMSGELGPVIRRNLVYVLVAVFLAGVIAVGAELILG